MATLSYAHGICDTPLLGETISQNLKRTVDKYPYSEALVVPYQNYRATYHQFWEQLGHVAKGILAMGAKKGDRVGIWSPNRYEWVLVQYAAARIGVVLVNINPAYRASELKYALNQSEVSVLIMAKGFRQTNYVEILESVKAECTHLKKTVVLEYDWENML